MRSSSQPASQPAITFNPFLQQQFEDSGRSLHSPLFWLHNFYLGWNSLLPHSRERIIFSWQKRKVVGKRDGVILYEYLMGGPNDIFSVLESEPEILSKLDAKIKTASRAMLLGTVAVSSALETAYWLEKKGFEGALTVYDISSVPIEINKIYQKFGLFPDSFRINFEQRDVLTLNQVSSADFILSDVLGIYLSHKQYKQLGQVVNTVLKPDGFWITRELIEPQGMPEPKDRDLLNGSQVQQVDGFNEFIQRLFGFKLPVKNLETFVTAKWAKHPCTLRFSGEDYHSLFPNNLQVEKTVPISSENLIASSRPRIFECMVVSKSN